MEGGHCDGTPAAAAGDADIDQGSHTIEFRACAAWPLPADPTCASIARRTFRRSAGPAWIPAATAMTEFQEALTAHGFTGRTVRADDPAAAMTVLSVSGGLTVWCWSGLAWLRAPGYSSDQWRYCDLVEVAEQTVEAYESLAGVAEPALLADAARAGALRPGPVHAVRERPVGAQHDIPEPVDADIGRHERVRGN